jgi:acetoin utilization deacetylase AcuC-like enzyme
MNSDDGLKVYDLAERLLASIPRGFRRVMSLLEGGYQVDRLAECVELHLRTLLSHAAQ